jgi:hypothetical protein
MLNYYKSTNETVKNLMSLNGKRNRSFTGNKMKQNAFRNYPKRFERIPTDNPRKKVLQFYIKVLQIITHKIKNCKTFFRFLQNFLAGISSVQGVDLRPHT